MNKYASLTHCITSIFWCGSFGSFRAMKVYKTEQSLHNVLATVLDGGAQYTTHAQFFNVVNYTESTQTAG